MQDENFDLVSWPFKLDGSFLHSEFEYPIEFTYYVKTPSEFIRVIELIYSRMEPYREEIDLQLWFRGHPSIDHKLIPSIIRKYSEKPRNCSISAFQRALLENFLSKGKENIIFSNMVNKQNNAIIEHIADMQHYFIPTNLLDWSENPFVSLYFACERIMVEEHPPKEIEDVVVYVLNPYLYNLVRSEIIRSFQGKITQSGRRTEENRNFNTATCLGSVVPNFAVDYNLNAPMYRDFVLGQEDFASYTTSAGLREENPLEEIDTEEVKLSESAPYLPLAVQLPRDNPRILAQRGTFLAFNLSERPIKGMEKDRYHFGFPHIELENVQNYYLNNKKYKNPYKSIKEKVPYIYKIIIKQEYINQFRKMLNAISIHKELIYPEMENLGKKIANIVIN